MKINLRVKHKDLKPGTHEVSTWLGSLLITSKHATEVKNDSKEHQPAQSVPGATRSAIPSIGKNPENKRRQKRVSKSDSSTGTVSSSESDS